MSVSISVIIQISCVVTIYSTNKISSSKNAILFSADPLYIAFHDEEWGVPVDDDIKLFELLVFSQALAEHSWPAILNHRDIFRHVNFLLLC